MIAAGSGTTGGHRKEGREKVRNQLIAEMQARIVRQDFLCLIAQHRHRWPSPLAKPEADRCQYGKAKAISGADFESAVSEYRLMPQRLVPAFSRTLSLIEMTSNDTRQVTTAAIA